MRVVSIKFFLIVLFISAIVPPSFSQKLTPKQQNIIAKDLSHYIFNDTIYFNFNMGLKCFAISDKDTFYNPNGFHLLYLLKNGSAERLDKSYFHGHNFDRFMYTHNNKIYLMGGYGMFNTNNIIESFDLNTQEWNYVSSKGERPEFIFGITFKKDSIIYLFNSLKSGNDVEPDVLDPYFYKLNINTNVWEKSLNSNSLFSNICFISTYPLKDYTISFTADKVFIISKKEMKCLMLNKLDLPSLINNAAIVSLSNNTLLYKNFGSVNPKKFYLLNLNVDSVYKHHLGQSIDLIITPLGYFTNNDYFFIILLLVIGIIIIYVIKRLKKRTKISIEGINENNILPSPLVLKLINYISEKITVEELDILFEIDHMEAESKKSKRHRIISHLDQVHPGLITRVKDETDKRKFVYHIDKQIHM